MKAAFRCDADLESAMQLALGIVNIRLAPSDDCASLDRGFGKICSIQITQRRDDVQQVQRNVPVSMRERSGSEG